MNSEESKHPLEALYRAMGHRVIHRDGVLWIDIGAFCLMTLPSVVPVSTSLSGIGDLLRESHRLAAVFRADRPCGFESHAYYVRDKNYGPASLQRQYRQNLNRGLETCRTRAMSWDELRDQGIKVNADMMRRRGVRPGVFSDPAAWGRICRIASEIPQLNVLGCFCRGELAAYVISWTDQGVCEGIMAHWSDQFPDARPAHVIYYEFTREMISRSEVTAVTVGRGALPLKPTLDRFKRHAGYQVETIPLGVVLHPRWAKLIQSRLSLGVLDCLRGWVGKRLPILENAEVFKVAALTRLRDSG